MLFTIITACYNSAKTLKRTYQSLLAQSYKDFEWILIDDGSNDQGQTQSLIKTLANEAPFPTQFKFLDKNHFASKSVARGCDMASGDYACILDHDDQLMPDALEKVKDYLDKYRGHQRIAGVCGRCVNENGKLIGKRFICDEQIATEGDIRFKQRILSELLQFTRLDLVKKWFGQMKPGYTNGYAWAKIAKDWSYVYVNDVFRIYDTSLPTSYTNSNQYQRFPENRAEAILETLQCFERYYFYNLFYTLKMCGSLIRHRINAGLGILPPKTQGPWMRAFLWLAIPLGIIKSKTR